MRGEVRTGTFPRMADSPLPMLALVAVSTVVICLLPRRPRNS
jgi:hypothetical protein